MDRSLVVYLAYILFFAFLVGLILVVPFLAFTQDMSGFYSAFAPTCHQKLSRSLCLFSDGEGYWFQDCLPQEGEYIRGRPDREIVMVEAEGNTGYKMPVCSRDIGLYGAMLLGALAYPFTRKLNEKAMLPSIFLVLALVPIGLDGGVQIVSEIGLLPFVYESTNTIRLLTGAIAGFAASFYAIPILLNVVSKD